MLILLRNAVFLMLVLAFVEACGGPEPIISHTHTVEMKDMQFQPSTLTVQKGDTVVFINNDMVVHNVVEENNAWTSGLLAAGENFKKVFTESANYSCTMHPVMKGNILVE